MPQVLQNSVSGFFPGQFLSQQAQKNTVNSYNSRSKCDRKIRRRVYVEDIRSSRSSSSRSSRRSLMRKVRSALAEAGGELSEDAASGPGDCDREPPDATEAACGAAHGSCRRAPCVTSSLKQSSRLMIAPNVYGWTTDIQTCEFQPLLLSLTRHRASKTTR